MGTDGLDSLPLNEDLVIRASVYGYSLARIKHERPVHAAHGGMEVASHPGKEVIPLKV